MKQPSSKNVSAQQHEQMYPAPPLGLEAGVSRPYRNEGDATSYCTRPNSNQENNTNKASSQGSLLLVASLPGMKAAGALVGVAVVVVFHFFPFCLPYGRACLSPAC